jgi:hypothetical protein
VHRNAHTTLQAAADIVAVPGNTLRNIGIDAACKEETASVFDSCVVRRDEHDESNDSGAEEADHEHAASLQAIREIAAADTADAGCHVGGDGHQLGGFVRVAQGADDGGEEE